MSEQSLHYQNGWDDAENKYANYLSPEQVVEKCESCVHLRTLRAFNSGKPESWPERVEECHLYDAEQDCCVASYAFCRGKGCGLNQHVEQAIAEAVKQEREKLERVLLPMRRALEADEMQCAGRVRPKSPVVHDEPPPVHRPLVGVPVGVVQPLSYAHGLGL